MIHRSTCPLCGAIEADCDFVGDRIVCRLCGTSSALARLDSKERGRYLSRDELASCYLAEEWVCPNCGRTGKECSACVSGYCYGTSKEIANA